MTTDNPSFCCLAAMAKNPWCEYRTNMRTETTVNKIPGNVDGLIQRCRTKQQKGDCIRPRDLEAAIADGEAFLAST